LLRCCSGKSRWDSTSVSLSSMKAASFGHFGRNFDGALEDVFDLQDKVATSVAGVIEPALQAAETAGSARRPTSASS
jgi:hypothetical protein